jgi:hypothetical protein
MAARRAGKVSESGGPTEKCASVGLLEEIVAGSALPNRPYTRTGSRCPMRGFGVLQWEYFIEWDSWAMASAVPWLH